MTGMKFLQCDVTDRGQVEAAVAAVLAAWGRIDILVNNACLAIFASFETRSLEETRLPGIYGYASTKGAIEALTRTLAIELAPHGIAVNLVHPPLTRTAAAAPLGIPPQFMADPAVVAGKLARKIGSTTAPATMAPP